MDTLREALPGVAFAVETGRRMLVRTRLHQAHPPGPAPIREVPIVLRRGRAGRQAAGLVGAHAVDEMFTAAVAPSRARPR